MRKLILVLIVVISLVPPVDACGGLFCQNSPVLQSEERIIFTINDDDTVTAYVQIYYSGSAPNFAWVVPVPDVPEIDVADVELFDELDRLTTPEFIAPPRPDCAIALAPTPSPARTATPSPTGTIFATVEVLASGAVGPYAYDVIQSPDPLALTQWLRANDYRITPQMDPLIAAYTDEGMIFLAMKLQPDSGVQEIQPIVMTYPSTMPMIPLRLTAIAAEPNMTVKTWIFGNHQTRPANYAYPTIEDEDIRFTENNRHNYMQLLHRTVDLYEGRAMVTEYAQPTFDLFNSNPRDSLLNDLLINYAYVTRFRGQMSPEEMTIDPMFEYAEGADDVPRVRDLRNMDADLLWGCREVPSVEYNIQVVPEGFE
jgi:hypothetical protein